jgi:hypothetical protein
MAESIHTRCPDQPNDYVLLHEATDTARYARETNEI